MLFDSVMDVAAGFIIDQTQTKWGKGGGITQEEGEIFVNQYYGLQPGTITKEEREHSELAREYAHDCTNNSSTI